MFQRRKFNLNTYLKAQKLVLTDHFSIFLATITMSVLALSVPIMTLQVYDRILESPEGGTLPILMGGVVVAIILEASLRLARSYLVHHASAIFEHKMNCQLFFHTLYTNFGKLPNFNSGRYQQSFGSINVVKADYTGQSFVVLCETLLLPFFLLLLFYIVQWLVLLPIALIVIYASLTFILGLRLKKQTEARTLYDEDRYGFLLKTLSGAHSIKAFGIEKLFERQYERFKEDAGRSSYKVAQLNQSMSNLGAVFSILTTVSMMTGGAWLVIHNELTTGELIAVTLITGRIMQPVQKMVAMTTNTFHKKRARKELEEILAAPTDRPLNLIYPDGSSPHTHESPNPEGRLSVKDVTFQFGGQNDPLFKNLSLEVSPGEMISIQGEFGSGKTTLLKLLCGIYPPDEGEILIDGKEVTHYSQEDLPKHVGLVESRGVLFQGTIRDNISRFGLTPENQAREAASLLDMNNEIARLPSGFDTLLSGKINETLQPGLRQKIALARTLAMRSRLLLLDEPTRDMDFESYNTLFTALAKLKEHITIILITSDKNLNSLSDTFYKIEDKTLKPQ